jgi:hypothetical protein
MYNYVHLKYKSYICMWDAENTKFCTGTKNLMPHVGQFSRDLAVLKYLKLCKISGLHGGDYEECCLLGCYAVSFLQQPHDITSQKTAFLIINFYFHRGQRQVRKCVFSFLITRSIAAMNNPKRL